MDFEIQNLTDSNSNFTLFKKSLKILNHSLRKSRKFFKKNLLCIMRRCKIMLQTLENTLSITYDDSEEVKDFFYHDDLSRERKEKRVLRIRKTNSSRV